MTQWISAHGHTTFSLLDGISKPQEIANKCKENGMPACAITDHGTLSGTLKFVKACKEAKIKPILGNEMYICSEPASIKTPANRQLSHLVVLSKSLQGWRNLIKASSASHRPENFYYKPRLDIKSLGKYAEGEFIVISGHMGSTLANSLLTDLRAPYKAQTYEEARKFIKSDWKTIVEQYVDLYSNLFGRENVKFEIQLIDAERLPIALAIAKILRHMGPKLGVDCVATADSHYINQEDAALQRIVLCTRFQTTLRQVQNRIDNEEDTELGGFFQSNNYHLPTPEEMGRIHAGFEGELENSLKIADLCQDYSILKSPSIPKFGPDDEALLKGMCHKGWQSKVLGKIPEDKLPEYTERLERELSVLQGAGLSSYFCIVQDFLGKAKDRGELTVVRGSATGCLVSYLIGISDVDPIKYGLLFERFYNAGRNSPGHISFPDIDCDLETANRHKTIEYIKDKYGRDHVGQICTFGRLMGRAALKDVLRVNEACSYDEMNEITKFIPDESKISDDLQEMREEGQEASIILWALQNNTKDLKPWCEVREDGSFDGRFARYFKQAMRLEGVKRSQGKHAAGLVISTEPISDVVPMIYDKTNDEPICGLEFTDLEAIGMVKMDLLGTTVLDKLSGVQRFLATGEVD